MDTEEVRRRVMAREMAVAKAHVERAEAQYTYVRPFLSAAVELIDYLTDESPRFMWGLDELDEPMQGIARGELCFLTGRAHSGKTQLVLNALMHQPEMRMLWFTPDETAGKVLSQIVSLVYNVSLTRLRERLMARDHDAFNLVHNVPRAIVPNLVVVPQALTFLQMDDATKQAEDAWQAPCEAVMVDYLDLLPGTTDYNGTKNKTVGVKAYAKRSNVPVVCVHQPRRGGAERGARIGMDDLSMAGDTEATFVLGVHRKKDRPRATLEETYAHANTVSVWVDKNKHGPDSGFGVDFFMHPTSGRIRSLRPEDLAYPGQVLTSAREALSVAARLHEPDSDQVINLAARRLG